MSSPTPTQETMFPTNELLRPRQLVEYDQEIDAANAQLDNPRVQDKGGVRKRLASMKRDVETQRPVPITDPRERDKASKRELELREKITEGMLSKEEMRKCGPTAVDRHLRWERANMKRIQEWKHIRLRLAADSSNPRTWDSDTANLEQYRPENREQGIRTDSLIQGIHTMSPTAKENWPLGEPTVDTPLKQAKRISSEARLLQSERMKAFWAAKKQQTP